jgi:hypothetical protein
LSPDGARTAGSPVAGARIARHTDLVTSWGSLSFLFGPVVAFGVVGVLVLLLRWAFSGGRSLVERRPVPGPHDQYGLLVRVAAPATFVEAEMIRRRLVAAGLRATLAPTTEGPAVMVFPEDERTARLVMRST